MEEILELKQKLQENDLEAAILIVDELEVIGRQDKINTLESFLVVLLIHLMKIQVENRVTKSWENSIINSLCEIQERNKLGKNSYYIKQGFWQEHILEKESRAVVKASKEVFGGMETRSLRKIINFTQLEKEAIKLLDLTYNKNAEEIEEFVREFYSSEG